VAIGNIFQPFGIVYDHLIFFGNLDYFSRFGMMNREKSGNPDV
jgi:hypothetical protein